MHVKKLNDVEGNMGNSSPPSNLSHPWGPSRGAPFMISIVGPTESYPRTCDT